MSHLNIVPNEGTPNFAVTATVDEGLYAMEDDYGTSYYYRGAVTNNYVKFGDYCWRIIRINGDGSLRIIYDGIQCYANGVSDENRAVYSRQKYNTQNRDAKYLGWMYGGVQGEPSTSKEQAQTNETDSDLKIVVDEWYKTNIQDKNLGDKVSDTLFCNDRSIPGKAETGWSNDTELGYGNMGTAYGSTIRVGYWSNDPSKVQPIFTCPQKNDAFTVDDEMKGNGDLTYPIGLITADEIVAAGSGKYNLANKNYYLYKGVSYWVLSPLQLNSTRNAIVSIVGISGQLVYLYSDSSIGAVVPVINLKPEYVQTMIGDGTINNPYREEGTSI